MKAHGFKQDAAPKIKVIPGDDPPAPEVMAQAIVDISAGMKKLNSSRLRRDTVVILLQDATGLPKRDLNRVLNAINDLERLYLKPAPL